MGVIETLAILAGIGGIGYLTVYYIMPMMQYQSMLPYYFMQQAAAAQQPAPAPAAPYIPPAPVPEEVAVENEIADATGEEALEDTVEEAVTEGLEDAGVVAAEEPAEEEDSNTKEENRKKSAEEELKSKNKEQKKKREEYDKATDPKKDTRYKGMSSKDAGRAAAKALGLQVILTPRSRPYKKIGIDYYGNYINL